MEYSPKKMQENLDNNNFKFKKQFGQNFICDENVINNIVTLSGVDKNTLVIEIGPGAGSLTAKLAKAAANVLCYEIDETVADILKNNISEHNNVDIIFKDFLKCNVLNDIKKYNYDKLYVVANLPYYITTPIIVKLIEDNIPVSKIVVMVQKEVGDRFKASPKSKDYGSLTVFLDYYFDVKKIMDVSKNIFIPKPNVDSIVVEFTKKKSIKKAKNEKLFFEIVRNSFKQKRKTIKNNLKEYDLEVIEKVLLKYNFTLQTRAEEISTEVFIEIANELSDKND